MSGQAHFLLINGACDHYWRKILEEALAPLGTLEVGKEEDAVKLVRLGSYDLVIVDATAVEDVPLLVARIRAQQSDARIVVATASPTWTRARKAFQSGATDYIRKSLDREDILSAVEAALVKILPP
jgi:DNA-binding NtrC family response regulator